MTGKTKKNNHGVPLTLTLTLTTDSPSCRFVPPKSLVFVFFHSNTFVISWNFEKDTHKERTYGEDGDASIELLFRKIG